MPAIQRDIEIEQGATKRLRFRWLTQASRTAPKVPVDLTGCTARLHVRTDANGTKLFAGLTTENGGIVLGGPAGTIDIEFTPASTSALSGRTRFSYDLDIQHGANGDVTRFAVGNVWVSRDIK